MRTISDLLDNDGSGWGENHDYGLVHFRSRERSVKMLVNLQISGFILDRTLWFRADVPPCT